MVERLLNQDIKPCLFAFEQGTKAPSLEVNVLLERILCVWQQVLTLNEVKNRNQAI